LLHESSEIQPFGGLLPNLPPGCRTALSQGYRREAFELLDGGKQKRLNKIILMKIINALINIDIKNQIPLNREIANNAIKLRHHFG
jgi:hypothetical protein